jgi:hypothetical protein
MPWIPCIKQYEKYGKKRYVKIAGKTYLADAILAGAWRKCILRLL